MVFYDLIHGYQPFDPLLIIPKGGSRVSLHYPPKWVRRNLKHVFLPTSLAMKQGIIMRSIQLQGWTIESWLNTNSDIKKLAKETLFNLRKAYQKGNIDIGISAYSHAILPMLSNDLIKAQIILDQEVITEYMGKPVWFWPPEGAVDKRVLKIVYDTFPKLIVVIPDKAIGRDNFMGPIKIKMKNGYQKALVFSTLFKNVFMNADAFQKSTRYGRRPKHLPKQLVFSHVRRAVYSSKIFLELLDFIKNKDYGVRTSVILMRDWENAGSKKGLRKLPAPDVEEERTCSDRIGSDGKISGAKTTTAAKDIGVFVKLKDKIDFCLPSQIDWEKAETFSIFKILPASWEMVSTPKDPYPFWRPNKHGKIWRQRKPLKRRKISEWHELVKEYDAIFQHRIKQYGGLNKALQDKKFKRILKNTLPAVHSCIGWHYFAKRAWGNYAYAKRMTENIVLPAIEKMKALD